MKPQRGSQGESVSSLIVSPWAGCLSGHRKALYSSNSIPRVAARNGTCLPAERKERPMTNPKKVYEFLNAHSRQGFCDDCIGKKIAVDRHEVNIIASTLALFPDEFSRSLRVCQQACRKRVKLVTMAK
jgi:hypothetical protein